MGHAREEVDRVLIRLVGMAMVGEVLHRVSGVRTRDQWRNADALITREQEREMRLIENSILGLPRMPAMGFELGLR